MLIDQNFKNWIEGLSKNYKKAQIKAAIHVNSELIKFYYELGEEISKSSELEENIIPQISMELIKITDSKRNFSETNLRYCVTFYKAYKNATKEEFELIEMIPWSTHIKILNSSKSFDDAFQKIKNVLETK